MGRPTQTIEQRQRRGLVFYGFQRPLMLGFVTFLLMISTRDSTRPAQVSAFLLSQSGVGRLLGAEVQYNNVVPMNIHFVSSSWPKKSVANLIFIQDLWARGSVILRMWRRITLSMDLKWLSSFLEQKLRFCIHTEFSLNQD